MGRDIRVWLALGILVLVGTGTSARAQVNPANMQSGCINVAAGGGLLEASLYAVPPDPASSHRLQISPPRLPGSASGRRVGSVDVDPRLEPGQQRALGDRRALGRQRQPQLAGARELDDGDRLLRERDPALRHRGHHIPASTICWSGYLVPNVTSSVNPTLETPNLGIRVAPNPATSDVGLSFDLEKRQSVVLAVFSVEGRRIRTLQRGTLGRATTSSHGTGSTITASRWRTACTSHASRPRGLAYDEPRAHALMGAGTASA